MTGDTKTSVYIRNGDASEAGQNALRAQARVLYRVGSVRTKARLSG